VNQITHETRRDAYQAILPFAADIRSRVLAVLANHPAGLMAEEVAMIVGCSLNCGRSRLTELKISGRVVAMSKRKSPTSGVNVAVFQAVI
jgi:hypothetical protein